MALVTRGRAQLLVPKGVSGLASEQEAENGKVVAYRTRVQLSFKYEA